MIERNILSALVARKLETSISSFVAEHDSAMGKLGIDPEQIKELLWELAGEAVKLHQEHKS